jgi:hypothetical protein
MYRFAVRLRAIVALHEHRRPVSSVVSRNTQRSHHDDEDKDSFP